jgi:photosystem II stability/assembly factor-like uncharacterized protein
MIGRALLLLVLLPGAANLINAAGMPHGSLANHPLVMPVSSSCHARNLRMFAQWQGAGQSEVGGIAIVGEPGCVLRGYPGISLGDRSGHALHVAVRHMGAETIPPLGPVPGRPVAYVSLWWANWCGGQVRLPITLDLTLPEDRGRLKTAARYGNFSRRVWAHRPPCIAPGHPSILTVGPFERPRARAYVRDAGRVTPGVGWRLTGSALEITRDAGATWTNRTPATVQADLIRAVFFVDALHGWLVISAGTGRDAATLLAYRTTNGGRSWGSARVAAPSMDFASAPAGSAWIDFIDARHGWIEVQLATSANFSWADLFRTDDGGRTWSAVESPAAGEIAFATRRDGWLAGGVADSRLFSTHDGGRTWSAAALPLPSRGGPGTVAFSLAGRGGRAGLRADLPGKTGSAWLFRLTPHDTWQLVRRLADPSIGEANPAAAPVAFAGSGALATVLDRGREIAVIPAPRRSEERVRSNLPITPNALVNGLSFVSLRQGWAIVSGARCAQFKRQCTSYSVLYATTDGGAHWTRLGG